MEKGGIRISFGSSNRPGNEPLPLKILIMGNFSGTEPEKRQVSEQADKIIQTAQLRSIASDNLDEFFHDLNVRLYISPANNSLARSNQGYFIFKPRNLSDFTPARIIETTEEFSLINSLLEQARQLCTGQSSAAHFRNILNANSDYAPLRPVFDILDSYDRSDNTDGNSSDNESSSAENQQTDSADNTQDDPVSRLLDLVDNAGNQPGTESSQTELDNDAAQALVDGFINRINKSKNRKNSASYHLVVQYLETLLEEEVSHYIHDEGFQSVESLWRGLKLLVQRTNFRDPIQIDCLSVSRDSLLNSFKQLIVDNLDSAEMQQYNAIISAFAIRNTQADITDLQTLAEHAESMQSPLIVSLTNEFFNTPGNNLINIENPTTWFDKTEFIQWNSLRKKSCARWLIALCNSFVSRNMFEKDMRSSAGLNEIIQARDNILWTNPGFLVASLITRSFEQTGWPTEIQGHENGEIDDLALYGNRNRIHQDVFQTLEFAFNISRVEDFATVGITALTCFENSDKAYVMYLPCVYEISKFSDARYNELSGAMNNLPYQLLLALISHYVSRHQFNLRQLRDETEIKDSVSALLGELLVHTGKGAQLNISVEKEEDDKSDRHVVFIHAVTGNRVLNGAEVEFGLVI